MTEEYFQPARIYYDVYDQVALQNIFLDLKCMDYDDRKKRWVWNYTDEAKTIHFKRAWSELTKETQPLVTGSLYAPQENQMYVVSIHLSGYLRLYWQSKYLNFPYSPETVPDRKLQILH